jgi:hypothetical protein
MGVPEDRKLALERLRVRREMRSMDLEEDSQVIEREAQSRAGKSIPPPLSWLVAIVRLVPPKQRVWPVLMVLGLVAAWAAKKAGIF